MQVGTRLKWRSVLGMFAACVGLAGCGGGETEQDIASALRAQPALSTFAAVLQVSGLEPALSEASGVTVFAPTDAAFEAFWAQSGTSRERLLGDPAQAAALVRDHLVDRPLGRDDLPGGRSITARSGNVFKVEAVAEGLVATDGRQGRARIAPFSLRTDQGFVHAVDAVLRPAEHSVWRIVESGPQTAWLAEALAVAGLAETLQASAGRLTLFAPTESAWQAWLAESGETWNGLRAQPLRLRRVLAYHVLSGPFLRAELPVDTPIAMLEGGQIRVERDGTLTDECRCPARIVVADRLATNGVVHQIDRVLLRNP
jgi:uncharacterized surface protein with fasciclin (FAS1) repeats